KHWPPHNSAQKRKTRRTHIIRYTDQSGYERLAVQTASKVSGSVKSFASLAAANRWLHALAIEFTIDQRLLGLSMFDATAQLPKIEVHNQLLNDSVAVMLERDPSYVIECAGRQAGERTYVLVERGQLRGYVFSSEAMLDVETIEFHLVPLQHSENTHSILDAFIEGRWGYKRIDLSRQTV
ncbi:MAG: hypothetical protein ACKO7B_12075, partial [Flavobacteriales bacterium]